MKRINFLLIALSLFIFTSCEQEDYEFGDILSPTNLTISATLQGADADNPYGDGSGYVTFTATAADAITYKFIQDGVEYMVPSGVFTTRFTNTGVHVYSVEVIASGTAGVMSNGSTSVEVLYTFEPPADLVEALTTGSWRVMAEALHIWELARQMIWHQMVLHYGGTQDLLIKLTLQCMMTEWFFRLMELWSIKQQEVFLEKHRHWRRSFLEIRD